MSETGMSEKGISGTGISGTRTRAADVDAPEATAPFEMRADCVADSAGGLTFDIRVPEDGPEVWSAALVLRRRGSGPEPEEVRLPLGPNGSGWLRAVLPSTVALAEGRWDAYTDLGDGTEPRRLLPGLNDLRSLVERRPAADARRLAVRVPYATKHGNLALRGWLRGPHAEAGEIRVSPEGVTVHGRLYGERPAEGAVAEARRRRDGATTITVALTPEEGQDFSFTLDHGPLAAAWESGDEAWDLWVRAAEGAEPVRLARILDDVADKKQIFSYPARPVPAERGPLRVGPYYTVDNDLSVLVAPPEAA